MRSGNRIGKVELHLLKIQVVSGLPRFDSIGEKIEYLARSEVVLKPLQRHEIFQPRDDDKTIHQELKRRVQRDGRKLRVAKSERVPVPRLYADIRESALRTCTPHADYAEVFRSLTDGPAKIFWPGERELNAIPKVRATDDSVRSEVDKILRANVEDPSLPFQVRDGNVALMYLQMMAIYSAQRTLSEVMLMADFGENPSSTFDRVVPE